VDGAASADLSMLQCASYALEMLCHGGLCSHVISALVTDNTIQLLYYDRLIIIVSRPVNFLEDPSRFVTMLHAIANLTLPHLGYADVVKPAPLLNNPRQTTDIFNGLELKLSDGNRLLLGMAPSF
jgi:Fungal protein kinase